MSPLFSFILSPAWRFLLVTRLQNVICLPKRSPATTAIARLLAATCPGSLPAPLPAQAIPLKHIQNTAPLPIAYGSAIAYKLAPLWRCDPATIAQAIATDLKRPNPTDERQADLPALDRLWQYITLEVDTDGRLTFQVSEPGLAAWLNLLIGCSAAPKSLRLTRAGDRRLAPDSGIFDVFYAHARCCSLLRLGLQENVIAATIYQPDVAPLPWLTSEQKLRCRHPSEQQLIVRLVTTVDQLARLTEITHPAADPVDYLKLARSLSQQFQSFDAACRLFGAVSTTDPALAQARFGLVLATQLVLRSLLQNGLHQAAPSGF